MSVRLVTDQTQAEDRFRDAVKDFYAAGMKLVEAWDDSDAGFNADERFPLPARIAPPMSLDEWLTEFLVHYTENKEPI